MTDPGALSANQIEKLLARAKERPDLAAIEYGEFAPEELEPAAVEIPQVETRTMRSLVESDPKTYDSRRTRIRDRYIGVRFEGVARSAAGVIAGDKSAQARDQADKKIAAVRKDAMEDKLDAEYAVAKEKCDALAGSARDPSSRLEQARATPHRGCAR